MHGLRNDLCKGKLWIVPKQTYINTAVYSNVFKKKVTKAYGALIGVLTSNMTELDATNQKG